VFENRVLRRIFGPKKDDVTGEWRKLHNEELYGVYCAPKTYYLGGHVQKVEMGGERGTKGAEERCIQGFGGETEGKRQLGRPRRNGIILTWIFAKQDGACFGLIRLRIGI
jgi:hypothetical protein